MSVQLFVDNVQVPVNFIRFSDGASNVKLDWPEDLVAESLVVVSVSPETPADNVMWEVMLVCSAAAAIVVNQDGGEYDTKLVLNLPYLPHARADRIFERGNPDPLWLVTKLMLSCFHEVVVKDIHNREALEENLDTLEDNVELTEIDQTQCFLETFQRQREKWEGQKICLVAPDKGAFQKTRDVAIQLCGTDADATYVGANKVRDVSTGQILAITVPDHLQIHPGERVIIVDDICDGGGTFIPLAEKLRERGAESVELYVTHGIFSKGLNIFKGVIDKLHVNQTVGTFVNRTDIQNFNEGKEVK